MDILMTALIIGIIGLAVAPFFLLGGAFGAPKRARKVDPERNDGPITPAPTDASGPFPDISKKQTHDPDGDSGSDGGDGGGGD
jgi:hypothetical protein